MIKGAAKSVVNTVKGILTDPKKLLLTAGAVALSIVCPPAGVALAAVGAVSGGVKVAGGVANAVSAYTDPNATRDDVMNAAENIGAGALQVAMAGKALKGGLGKMGGVEGIKASGNGNFLKGFAKQTAETPLGKTLGSAGSKVAGNIKADGFLTGSKNTIVDAGKTAWTKGGELAGKAKDVGSTAFDSVKSGQAWETAKGLPSKAWGAVKDGSAWEATKNAGGKVADFAKTNQTALLTGAAVNAQTANTNQEWHQVYAQQAQTQGVPAQQLAFSPSVDYQALYNQLGQFNTQMSLMNNGIYG
jgi:hypothetical protein